MANPTKITKANFSTLLKESTNPRTGTGGSLPNGNVYFDTANDRIQLIGADELAQIDFGSGAEANPLTNSFGITLQALYAFERRQRRLNVSLRKFLPATDGVFQFAGAWVFDNGTKLDGNDRNKIRESGWIEYSATKQIDRIYFGVRSLNDIQPTSQPYIQLAQSLSEADLLAAAPINASRVGPLDEAFQVFGSTSHGDTNAGNFDFTTSRVLIAKVRTFGFTQGSATSSGSGVGTLQGFSAGFGLGESVSPTNAFSLANVVGDNAISPFTGMVFERRATPLSVSGFAQANGNFTDVLSNTNSGSLAQIRARLDGLMTLDTDVNSNTANTGVFRPKRASALYTIDDTGRLVTRQGLFLDNVPTADQQSVAFIDNAGNLKTYPFNVEIRVSVSDAWRNDANAWYVAYFKDGAGTADFDTANAVVVNNAAGSPVSGTSADATGSAGAYLITFSFDYDGNTQAGLTAATNKTIVFLAEGDGGAQATSVEIIITRQAIITAQALAEVETNI